MAQKRMFDRAIIETEKFTDMPMSSKGLYFLLGMAADDEGFVSAKHVLRVHGGTDDDLGILIAKGFCFRFKSGIIVITHWNKNNWLDTRRLRKTEYQEERSQLLLTDEGDYVLSAGLARVVESRIENANANANAAKAALPLIESKADADGDSLPNKEKPIKVKDDGAMRVMGMFSDECEQHFGMRPVSTIKGLSVIAHALKRVNSDQLDDYFAYWFALPKKEQDLMQPTQAFSNYAVDGFLTGI